jgi:hypothetical protein
MTDLNVPGAVFLLRRDAHLFSHQPGIAERLAGVRSALPLAPDELVHPDVPADYLVRLGKLRLSQLLPDGREVTRAVLQAGAVFTTRPPDEAAADPATDAYPLGDVILMAMGEAELWALPAGALAEASA